jgi:uncharacterized protein YjbK
MGSGLVKKKSYKGLMEYTKTLSLEEQKYFNYCVKNNIRISPVPTTQGLYPDEWKIEIRLGPYKKGEKSHKSPLSYNSKEIWPAINKVRKFYYDKRTR